VGDQIDSEDRLRSRRQACDLGELGLPVLYQSCHNSRRLKNNGKMWSAGMQDGRPADQVAIRLAL
jgi:hypothetical protein